jgi:hypothetical protein
MPKLAQISFAAGEVSPSVAMRTDLARYGTALKSCLNFFVRPTGGVSNRAGTRFIAATKDSGEKTSILLPFTFSTEQAYILEFGEEYVRIYAGATLVDEVTTPYQEDDLTTIRFAQSADVLTLAHPNFAQYELRRLSASSFELAAIDFKDGPFLDENTDEFIYVHASAKQGTVTLTSTTAIFEAVHIGGLFKLWQRNIESIKPWEPSKLMADDSTGVGEGSPFGILRRSDGKVYKCLTDEASGSSSFGTFTGTVRPTHDEGVQSDGDHSPIEDLATFSGVKWEFQHSGFGIMRITAVASGVSATATVLSQLPDDCVGGATTGAGPWTMTGDGSDVTLAVAGATSNDSNDFEVTFAGVIQKSNLYTVNATTDVLTFYTAPANGVAVSARQLSANNRTNVWAFGAWSEDQGYPAVVTYYQDRLVFANSPEQPQTEWASKTGEYHKFGVSSPLVDDDAITQTLNARQINAIRELVPLDQLIALTASSAWASPKRGAAWTPSTIGFDPQAYNGAADLRSVLVGDTALYAQDKATKIRDLRYQFDIDKFNGNELTVLARHLFKPSKYIVDMDYASEPHGILWVVRSDGALIGLTYLREQDVIGWHRHTTDGFFERVCVIPESGQDAVYFIVRRTIDGQTVRYIEKLGEREFEDIEDAFFVDSGLSYDGAPATVFTGLDHLEGETVAILADGSKETPQVVTAGRITLENAASVVHIGLPFSAEIETLDITIPNAPSVRDNSKNIGKLSVVVESTRGLKAGADADHLEEFGLRGDEEFDTPTDPLTGVMKFIIANTWNANGRILLRQDDPLPATILAVIPQVSLGPSS